MNSVAHVSHVLFTFYISCCCSTCRQTIKYAYMVSISNITLARAFQVVSISTIIYLLYRLLPLSIYMTINTVHRRRRCNDRYPLLHQARLRSFPFRWKSKKVKRDKNWKRMLSLVSNAMLVKYNGNLRRVFFVSISMLFADFLLWRKKTREKKSKEKSIIQCGKWELRVLIKKLSRPCEITLF